jgi:glycosyltransferase involved in cell wall biosynthesis
MHIGIDASNIRSGGGVTHLVELLRAADPRLHNFNNVTLWAGTATLSRVDDRAWLEKRSLPELDKGLFRRALWQRFQLSRVAQAAGCDVLFIPGGTFAGGFTPMVTMSRNMLPFEHREMLRYGASWMTLKLALLRLAQASTLRHANGAIFLTDHAQKCVTRVTGPLDGKVTIVPHGVDKRFVNAPRVQRPLSSYSSASPFRLIYVSTVDVYKHQCEVVRAVGRLRARGMPIAIDLVGSAYRPSLEKLRGVMLHVDPHHTFINYLGVVPYQELHRLYEAADMCVFASSCENMPNILIEGMASGLPTACSSYEPMPEVLGDAGVYFDPEDVDSIMEAFDRLMQSPELRREKADEAFKRAALYSWRRCADETFDFLAGVVKQGTDLARSGSLSGTLQ